MCVLERVEHGEEVDGEPGVMETKAEVHAGEEERVLAAEAAVGGVLDFGGGELGAQSVLYACEVCASDLQPDVPDAEGREAEGGVVGVAEDLLEVPRARAGVVVGCARHCFYAEVVDDCMHAAVENLEVVEHREHGEAVRGGVRVHAAGEGEFERIIFVTVLAEDIEHGAGGGVLSEDAVDSVAPGGAHGLEAAEAAQVAGGEKLRLCAADDVVEEVGVEALHCVCVWVCVCALVPEVLLLSLAEKISHI